jgi:hypothetical protein
MGQEFMRIQVVLKVPVDPVQYPGSKTAAERAEVARASLKDPKALMQAAEEHGIESVSVGSFTIEQ